MTKTSLSDPMSPETIAQITNEAESTAMAEFDMAERHAGSLPDPKTGRAPTIVDDLKKTKVTVKHSCDPTYASKQVAKETDPQKRWDAFKAEKGINEREVEERKSKTGVGVHVPTKDEIEVVASVKEVKSTELKKENFDKKVKEKKTKISGKVLKPTGRGTVSASKVADSSKEKKKVRRPAKRRPVKAEKLSPEQETRSTRKEVFKNNPDRTDWMVGDLVNLHNMHPRIRDIYKRKFRDERRRRVDLTYGEAMGVLKKMPHPMKLKHRMENYAYGQERGQHG